jgi:hypothetical protein
VARTIAVDFDGTLVENRFPGIGPPVPGAVQTLRAATARGDRLILWTCRTGRTLQDAVAWCRKHGLTLAGVNADPKRKGGPKLYADLYLDDKVPGALRDRFGKPMLDWTKAAAALKEQR